MYLLNAWCVAGWPYEIADKSLGRTYLNEPVVLYRGNDNRVVALEDRCCHRGMPLSHGEVFDCNIRSEYHGLLFDGSARCVDIPGQALISSNARVRSFPVEGRDDLVWIWMGDPAKAKADQITRYPWHGNWPYKSKSEGLKCNYLLASDNLLDQTHAAYVHKSTLASDSDAYARAEMQTTPTPDGVKFILWMLNCIPSGIYANAVKFKDRVDRWQEFEYVAPSCIPQFTGAVDVGMGAYENGVRDGGFGLRIFYGITPETDDTTWFFWCAANGYRQNEREATEQLFVSIEAAFKEDEVVLEAQHAMLRRLEDRSLININSEGARVHARLALNRKIAAEGDIPLEQVVTMV